MGKKNRLVLSQKLQGKLQNYGPWALVTGASSGIGEALVTRIAASKINLILSGRNRKKLEDLAASLRSDFDIKCQIVSVDLAYQEGIDLLIEETKAYDIGLFIASAGYGTSGSFLKADLYEELDMLKVNCDALLQLTHCFASRFKLRGNGGIVLMASLVGFQGTPFAAHYAATKAYVQSLAEALSVELKPEGIDVLAAAPGPVNSGFASRANMQMGATLKPEDIAVPILRALGKKQTVLPGLLTKFLVYALRTTPRWGKVKIMKLVMSGMTKHQIT